MKITILDPAMCCSTGVCGAEVDDNLVQTAANVKWLKSLGHDVHRHNISNDATAFKDYPGAIKKLQQEGTNSLPYIFINDQLVTSGYYPTKADWEMTLQNNIDINSDLLVGAAKEEKSSDGSCCSGSNRC